MNEREVQDALEVLLHSDVWIGDDGKPLDYLPERETRIGALAHELAALVAKARSDALREAADNLPIAREGQPWHWAADWLRRRADLLRAAASSHPTGNQP